MVKSKITYWKKYTELRGLVDKYDLHTICTSEAASIWENAGEKAQQHS